MISQPTGSRKAVIQAVQTPLGFFSLVVLVVEGLLAIAVGVARDHVDPAYILSAMLGLIILLVVLVASLAIFRPEALQGRRVAVTASALSLERRHAPAVLCIQGAAESSPAAVAQVDLLRRTFPNVRVERTASGIQHAYDIVHCIIDSGSDATIEHELTTLAEASRPRLIVLMGNESVATAARLARRTNVIVAAAAGVDATSKWVQSFYEQLADGTPLTVAHARALEATSADVLLAAHRDVSFAR